MATEKKLSKQAVKRSSSSVGVEQTTTSDILLTPLEWSTGHEFISPHEINIQAIGLLFCLTTKNLINTPFTTLYRRSLKITWTDLLTRERRNLKSNISSVEKCFMINRLITECAKDPCKFAQQTGELYEEIKMRISSALPSTWSIDGFYGQLQSWRDLQIRRRLFHISHEEANRPQSLLTLQQIATILYSRFVNSYLVNPSMETYNHLKYFLQNSFIIIAQPSIPECVAATKYEKTGNTYLAKLCTRIICLIDPDIIEKHCTLYNVAVTLYPFDRDADPLVEDQPVLKWSKKTIKDAEELPKTFLYVELESIETKKQDVRNSRPLSSAKLCQLQFQIKIRINELNFEENVTFLSQPFGLCSHAQYYPEYVAKVLLYEVEQIPPTSNSVIQPEILTGYISRYHIRISGVEIKRHTSQYIRDILRKVYEEKITAQNATSSSVYEEILSRLISQMEMFIDHPFLSMMYQDGLFLGICDDMLDQQLQGTREQPHILLRFNSVSRHEATQHASIRFIVHNGQLTRATFHRKAFVDEMCWMICEANSEKAKKIQLLFETQNHHFHDFALYFDEELFRLHTAASPIIKGAYQPFIPILWNTMRTNPDEQSRLTEQPLNSPSFDSELIKIDLPQASISSTNQIQIELSSLTAISDQSKISNEKVTIQIDMLVHHLVEKLSDLLIKSSTENTSSAPPHITKASTLLSTVTDGNIQQQKQLLSHSIYDYFQSQTHIDVATQTSPPASPNSLANIFDDT